MFINGVAIEDTFAEAFQMYGTRIIITAITPEWAMTTARVVTGFATSVIGCGCEAGIEGTVEDTPDGRPGVAVLFFGMSKNDLEKQLIKRVGQGIMTAPTSACYNGLPVTERLEVGGKIRFFGDGFQISKVVEGRRFWRIPVMEGEFILEESFGVKKSVGGGNFLILGEDLRRTLEAAETAVRAMTGIKGVALPFPGGIVRSGSKVGSRYKFLTASTNTPYCPTIKGQVQSSLEDTVGCVLEIVIDGLDLEDVEEAMRRGIEAACGPGIVKISAGNYGGNLGKYKIHLTDILERAL
ncbi:MAG: formylmethanofuran--tetrahydromethanopterin N-formyltransferase [Firmicutes bacterium]|nr:formylmethanofuran--tetrahydromethanopterin N-formyltransferase [Bacillota bacterium]